jgi:hypothetical protein
MNMKNKKNGQAVSTHLLSGVWLTLLSCLLLIFSACPKPTDEPTDNPIIRSVNRFQADPYVGNDKIKYSYTYDDYDFYYIYLGELKNNPMFFQTARYHSGIDWTYTFATTDITESSIREVVTESSQTVIGVTEEHTKSTTIGLSASAEINRGVTLFEIAEIGTKLGGAFTSSWLNSATMTGTIEKTTSLTDTVEHAISHALSTLESDQFSLGRNDKTGYYRYTMFSASDVYLFVIRDSKTNEIYYEFREYVIPDAYFYHLDYSETPSFKKSDATEFKFDISILRNLPKPNLDFLSYTIEYNANGGSGTMISDVHGYAIAQNLKLNTFTPPAGYSFAGWARSPTASNVEFSDGEIVFNLANVRNATVSLYAIWSLTDVIMERTIARGSSLIMSIPSNVTRAIIRGEYGETYSNSEIIVSERSLPLTIELHNVNAVGKAGSNGGTGQEGGIGKPVISMGTNNARVPNLTIASYGTKSRLVGGKGGNGGTGSSKSTGKNGGNGGAAVLAEIITITGDSNIILRGGDGGKGGRGGDTGVTFNGTSGGRGGNGGAAINANNITFNIAAIIAALKSQGGSGGSVYRGSTGLAVNGGSDGSSGSQGVQFTSTPVRTNGEVVDYEI